MTKSLDACNLNFSLPLFSIKARKVELKIKSFTFMEISGRDKNYNQLYFWKGEKSTLRGIGREF